MALVKNMATDEMVIKPETTMPNINYSDWPLLLKNWDQRMSIHIKRYKEACLDCIGSLADFPTYLRCLKK